MQIASRGGGREWKRQQPHHPQSIVIKINPMLVECSRDPYYNFLPPPTQHESTRSWSLTQDG